MNIPEAIKILILDGEENPKDPFCDLDRATKLGIEALKWRQLMEHDYGSWCGTPLPGETEGDTNEHF